MRYMKPWSLFQEILKAETKKQSRLLGLDVGDKYVGLAVSDPANKIASPVSVLQRTKTNMDVMAADFENLISIFSLAGFVIGSPSDRTRNTEEVVPIKLFVDELCKTGKLEGISYTYWDESFTSKNVELLIKPLAIHPVQAKTIVDKFAAVSILQGYLDYANKKQKLMAPK